MKFSIIVPYYIDNKGVSFNLINSLIKQKYKNFEVILLHDGNLKSKIELPDNNLNIKWYEHNERTNLWGHPLRDIGLKLAEGEWVLHTNMDNVYYEDSLEILSSNIDYWNKIIICKIRMMGLNYNNGKIWYDTPRDYSKSIVLNGNPPIHRNIDMMQLVSHKICWEDGWYNFHEESDGIIYQKMCERFEYKHIDFIIGEHY
jgi:cellulose synthase/poly-beta-1,6-N-acetylglucosamine synthase-like glycosyltransferase